MGFTNYRPIPEALIGNDAITALQAYSDKKIGLILDEGISKLPSLKRVTEELLKECQFKVIGYVGQEPIFQKIDPLITRVRDYQPDIIVAIGGGATIDTAKVLKIFCDKKDCTWKDLTDGSIYKTFGLSNAIKLFAVPTTSGTGSEASSCAVLTDYDGGKVVIISDEISPDKAILDFSLLKTLPKRVNAYSGLDALSHVMGALSCRELLSEPAKMNGIQVAVTIMKNLEPSFHGDQHAREIMHCAAFKAGETTKNVSCGLDHNLDRFAKDLKIPHGYVSGLLLLYTTRYLIPHENYIEIAEQMGFTGTSEKEKQNKLLEYLFTLYKRLEVPLCLKDYGIKESEYIPNIPRFIQEDKAIGTMYEVCSPTDEELHLLYRQFYYGLEAK